MELRVIGKLKGFISEWNCCIKKSYYIDRDIKVSSYYTPHEINVFPKEK